MKIQLEEILGEFVRHEGSEDRHGCLSCGSRDGLCVNWTKGVWHCWGCDRGGSTGKTTKVIIPPGSSIEIRLVKDGSFKTAWGDIEIKPERAKTELSSLFDERGYNLAKLQRRSWANCYYALASGITPVLAQKLHLKNLHCGWQFVSPKPIEAKKALIHGRRGVATGTRADAWLTNVIVVVEGFWDLLALRAAVIGAMVDTQMVQVLSLCGNTLSSEQLSEIVSRSQAATHLKMVYVATDNDQPEKTARIWNMLRVHMPCRIAEPPIEWGKDWDDAWQMHHDEALAFWAKRFVYRGSM